MEFTKIYLFFRCSLMKFIKVYREPATPTPPAHNLALSVPFQTAPCNGEFVFAFGGARAARKPPKGPPRGPFGAPGGPWGPQGALQGNWGVFESCYYQIERARHHLIGKSLVPV